MGTKPPIFDWIGVVWPVASVVIGLYAVKAKERRDYERGIDNRLTVVETRQGEHYEAITGRLSSIERKLDNLK